jgi:hypothetical protein
VPVFISTKPWGSAHQLPLIINLTAWHLFERNKASAEIKPGLSESMKATMAG